MLSLNFRIHVDFNGDKGFPVFITPWPRLQRKNERILLWRFLIPLCLLLPFFGVDAQRGSIAVVEISDATKSVLLHYRFRVILLLGLHLSQTEKKGTPQQHGNIAFELLHSFKDLLVSWML